MSLNSVILTGRITADPEIKATSQSILIANFSIAVNEFVKGEEHSSFFNCVAFNKTAERLQQYVKKGNLIGIEGNLRQSRWDDSDGNKKSKIEIIVNRVEILEWKRDANAPSQNYEGGNQNNNYNNNKQNNNAQNQNQYYNSNDADFIEDESDIPF